MAKACGARTGTAVSMASSTKILAPGAMPDLPQSGTLDAMARAAIHHLGEVYWSEVIRRARSEMAKAGFLGWQPEDGNCLIDIVPFGGKGKYAKSWAYRIRFAGTKPGGDVHVVEFVMPEDEVAAARRTQTDLKAG